MNEKIEKALKIIIKKLDGLNYVLIGSVNLYIQGINVKPRDIDILTNSDEINKIIKILKEYQTKEMYFDKSEGRNSYRVFFKINEIEIEVLGNVNNICRSKDSLDKKIFINYKGIEIPCMPFEDELEVYRKIGGEDKVRLIKDMNKELLFFNKLQRWMGRPICHKKYFYLDKWSFVHFVSGLILGFIFSCYFPINYAWLIVLGILIVYELFETAISGHLYRKELMINKVWDILIGMVGFFIIWLLL